MSEIRDLINLAWRQCSGEIYSVVKIYLGCFVFLIMFWTMVIVNMAGIQEQYTIVTLNYPVLEPLQMYDVVALIFSIVIGTINAVCIITFLAFNICLLEFTYYFCRIAYIYDNKSWVVVNVVKDVAARIKNHVNEERKTNRRIAEEYDRELREEIEVIKLQRNTDEL